MTPSRIEAHFPFGPRGSTMSGRLRLGTFGSSMPETADSTHAHSA